MIRIVILLFTTIFCIELFCQENAGSEKKMIFDIEKMYDLIVLDGKTPDNTAHLLYFKDMPTLSKALEDGKIICRDFDIDTQRCILKYGEKYRNGIIIFETVN